MGSEKIVKEGFNSPRLDYKPRSMNGKEDQFKELNPRTLKAQRMGSEGLQTSRLALDELCQFRRSEVSRKQIEEYLKYIKTTFPNESNNLGVLMHSRINETAALKLLQQTQYDVSKAKFMATFPTICRQLRIQKHGTDLRKEKLDPIFEKYIVMNTQLHSKNEATHFTKVLTGIESGDLNMSFEELSEIIMEARSNKYKLPSSVRKLFEDSFNGSREIEKMLEGSKKMEDLQLLFDRLKSLLVPPQNFYRLQEFLEKAKKFEQDILNLMTGPSKNVKDMQSKINSLKVLCLKSSVGDPIHEFKELWEKTHRYLEDIQQIVNPYNTKSNQRKSDFSKASKILNFFIDNKIRDSKIEALCVLVTETSRVLNVASLFLEDTQPASEDFLSTTVGFLEKSKFDMKVIIQKVKEKAEFLGELDHLRKNWMDEQLLTENLRRVDRLKEFEGTENLSKIEEFEKCLLNLQKIR